MAIKPTSLRTTILCLALALSAGSCLALVATSACAAPPHPGSLDRTFDRTGTVIHDFGVEPGSGGAQQVILQPDGKFLVHTDTGPIGRFLPDGGLDAGFGEDGFLTRVAGWGTMATTSDGRIVVASTTASPASEARVARFLPNGTPDPSFGKGGSILLPVPQKLVGSIAAVLVQPDGKLIVVGGATVDERHGSIEAIRLLRDGAIDTDYGRDGYAVVPLPSSVGGGPDLRAASLDGERLTMALSGGRADLLVARLDSQGALDPSLGGSGVLRSDLLEGIPVGVEVQTDGRIVVVSNAHMVARFMSDGSADLSFGEGGRAVLPELKRTHENTMVLQPDGKILLGGSVDDPATAEPRGFLLARLDADGTVDSTMGADHEGFTTTDLGGAPGSRIEGNDLAL
jgi:uncharacterized delta-60 repeat protein